MISLSMVARIIEPLWYRSSEPNLIPEDLNLCFRTSAEAIVLDAKFLEDATSKNVGLPAGGDGVSICVSQSPTKGAQKG